MNRLDPLIERLLVYHSISRFLHNQIADTQSLTESVVVARDCVDSLHIFYVQYQQRQEQAARAAAERFTRLMADARAERAQRLQAAFLSSPHGGSQLRPVREGSSKLQPKPHGRPRLTMAAKLDIPLQPRSTRKSVARAIPMKAPASKQAIDKAENHEMDGDNLMLWEYSEDALEECSKMEHNEMGMLLTAKSAYNDALCFEPENDQYRTGLADIEKKLLAQQIQAEIPESQVQSSIAPDFEYQKAQYDPNMIKAAKELLEDPSAHNIVAGMFETNTVEQNSLLDLFCHIRKDIDLDNSANVYKYPLEHILEEYLPEAKKRLKGAEGQRWWTKIK